MSSTRTTAVLHEVFSGIQGEGMLVGLRQIFVRFHGCNLDCAYCDTPAGHIQPPYVCNVECAAGSRQVAPHRNPLTPHALLDVIHTLQQSYPHHSISLTGGEPLLHIDFLAAFLPQLHAAGYYSMLETNGTLADALQSLPVLPQYIAMDIKLPSVTGDTPLWEAHAAFLEKSICRLSDDLPGEPLREHLQVKLIFGEQSLSDIEHAAQFIADYCFDLPCILQPVTPHHGGPQPPTTSTVLEAQRLAACHLREVRVIPQTHVLLGQW